MSYPIDQTISCRKCGNQQKFTCWGSINTSVDPELKNKLFQGKLTTYVCNHCGAEGEVTYDILYHDMDSPLLLYLKYPDEDGQIYLDDEIEGMAGLLGDHYTFRTVPSFRELVEKVKIFDDGFDDFTIELLKLMVCLREGIDIVDPFYYERKEGLFPSGKTIVLVHSVGEELIEKRYSVNKQLSTVKEVQEKIMSLVPKESDRWICLDRRYVLRKMEQSGLARTG